MLLGILLKSVCYQLASGNFGALPV